ncbi:protease HtpX, partial [Candidatus Bathyarchaeota archaeon]|nr:protease HtpX [Candidatus Bathyarchaeota archaeon]
MKNTISLVKLRLSMLTTLAIMIGASTLFFTIVLLYVNGSADILSLVVFVVGFNVIQWLTAPYLIDLMYQTREVSA